MDNHVVWLELEYNLHQGEMMKDLNKVFLEGTIIGNPILVESNGKQALNFTIESMVTQDKFFPHGCVLWDDAITKYGHFIKNGNFIRVEGHLQSGVLNYVEDGEAKVLYYDKTNVKFAEVEEM